MEPQRRNIHPDLNCRHAVSGNCTHPDGVHMCGTVLLWQCCKRCPHYDGAARGLGDIVAVATKAVGIAPCGGCQRRREALNAAVPNPFKGT